MLNHNKSNLAGQTYSRFSQVKAVIQGVEPIDYFFAKEMLSALIPASTALSSPSEPDSNSHLYHLFLALSASLRAGHSCLPLTAVADQHWGRGYTSPVNADSKTDEVIDQGVTHPGFVFATLTQLHAMVSALNIGAQDHQLLVLHHNNLYLRRYFQFENDLEQAIKTRLVVQCQYDNDDIAQCIEGLFPNTEEEQGGVSGEIDWQKVAVANAINKNFSVIAGGPGTGKTYTVTKLLAALVILAGKGLEEKYIAEKELAQQDAPMLNVALVAPTGKAAQRLSESIVKAITDFTGKIDDKVLAQIPTQAQTLHRLLGVLPNSPNFRHNEDNRLAYDIVLIDEVSMVDLPLMTRVFRALKDHAKVILLGDADQLPSVATGSVLADIAPRPHGGFSAANEQYLSQVCQLKAQQLSDYFTANKGVNAAIEAKGSYRHNAHFDYLSFLVKSRRFDGKGGIGLLANAVINGDVKRSWQLLVNAQKQALQKQSSQIPAELSMVQGELSQWLAPLVKQYYQPIEKCTTVSEAFALLAQFRVLCATRQGDYGVERLNEIIKDYLGKNNSPFGQHQHSLYHGQPIMINENDYRLGLYNGDIGIMWSVVDKEGKTHLMACFEDNSCQEKSREESSFNDSALESLTSESIVNESKDIDDKTLAGTVSTSIPPQGVRQILPSRLPKFESVYAMTIHKTQGSEFSHVAMVLSQTHGEQQNQQKGSKLLSRELLYTGITRAKKQLTLAASQGVWQQGVTTQVKRYSGLTINVLQP